MTICELNIEYNRNCIRSQIPWNTQTSYHTRNVSDRIPDRGSSVEKNIRPVKKGSKPPSDKKIPTASEVV